MEPIVLDAKAKRKVTVSEFKNKVLVNIREYYEDKGELKPGKKGISLSVEQWKILVENITKIDAEIASLTKD